jgi:predicted dehydrogenase
VEQSGDTILENQIHNIDVINWIMNDHPIRAAGLGGQNMIIWSGNELLDNYAVTYEYPGNRYATFSKISYAVSGLGGTFIHAYGEKAGADMSYSGDVKFIWRGKDTAATEIKADAVNMNLFSIQDFFQCVRNGKQPFAGIEIGKSATLTTLLTRKAIYEKRSVTWDELLREGSAPLPRRT